MLQPQAIIGSGGPTQRSDRVSHAGAAAAARACLHCAAPVHGEVEFCCHGCRAVHAALQHSGLTRFYELRGRRGAPVGDLGPAQRERDWLLQVPSIDAPRTLHLSVQGLRCSACVWLIERLFERSAGALSILINPARAELELRVRAPFELRAFVLELERFGYLLSPETQPASVPLERDALLTRFGVCAVMALNSMMFSAATYFGLHDGLLYEVLRRLNFAALSLSVLVGGPVFFGSALQALRRRMIHIDMPLALSIAIGYGAAAWAFVSDRDDAAYFDSLSSLIALLLLARYLQGRTLARSRAELPSSDEAVILRARRLVDQRVEVVPAGALRRDDELLIAPGGLVPARAELQDCFASCSLDFSDGESTPRRWGEGECIPAGAFNVGVHAIRVRLVEDFADSALVRLLRPEPSVAAICRRDRFARVARLYVWLVIGCSVSGFCYWLQAADLATALSVMTAVAAVSCPCAIGLSVPLAYEWTHAALRQHGIHVRSDSLLERLREVRAIAFDKTGTLTSAHMEIADPAAVHALPSWEKQALYDLVNRSLHPASIALSRLLMESGLRLRPEISVSEHPGLGLCAQVDGRAVRLGRAGWAIDGSERTGLCFSVDGRAVLELQAREQARPSAATEIAALLQLGYPSYVLSGDSAPAVTALATSLGVPHARALSELSPEAKRDFVQAIGPATLLVVGDGLNDSPAMQAAGCSGTVAPDRPLLAGRTDFCFTGGELSPVRALLLASRSVSAVIARNVTFAVLYNLLAISAALLGWMQPWIAAVLMPLSSLAIVSHTRLALASGSRRWTS